VQVAFELRGAPAVASGLAHALHQPLSTRDQLACIDRLGEHVVGAVRQRFDAQLGIRFRRQQQHRHVAVLGFAPQRVAQLEPVAPRQPPAGDHQFGHLVAHPAQCVVAVERRADAEVRRLQRAQDRFDDVRVLVRHQRERRRLVTRRPREPRDHGRSVGAGRRRMNCSR
jgi:hypothetical protein